MSTTTGHPIPLPPAFERGGYVARFARSIDDVRAAQRLRHLCFVERAGRDPLADGLDTDAFDDACDHVLIDGPNGDLACCFRVLALESGRKISTSYAAQYYDLTHLQNVPSSMVELGRFCTHPDVQDGAVLRIAWGMLAAYVDAHHADLLFGCSSFAGTDATQYSAAFDLLAAGYLAPKDWLIGEKVDDIVPFVATAVPVRDHREALSQVPPLLRTYLTMGGWVSEHAVIDRDMNTLHVFTGLEIAKIPTARAKALRAIVGADGLADTGRSR